VGAREGCSSSSSSSRECLVPKKQLLPSEVEVAGAYKAYPMTRIHLATMFQDLMEHQVWCWWLQPCADRCNCYYSTRCAFFDENPPVWRL
jgi:hypothetical protein